MTIMKKLSIIAIAMSLALTGFAQEVVTPQEESTYDKDKQNKEKTWSETDKKHKDKTWSEADKQHKDKTWSETDKHKDKTWSEASSTKDTSKNKDYSVTGDDMDKKEFIKSVAESSLLEVQLGQLAQQKATSDEVRELGMTLIEHHANANQELKQIAEQLQVEVPEELDSEDQMKLNDFQTTDNLDFNDQFLSTIIEQHKQDIANFERARQTIEDENLANWIDNTLPLLRNHLETAENLQNENETDSGLFE
jgi:putative membrane protein